jgi:hypothetical protein
MSIATSYDQVDGIVYGSDFLDYVSVSHFVLGTASMGFLQVNKII